MARAYDRRVDKKAWCNETPAVALSAMKNLNAGCRSMLLRVMTDCIAKLDE